MNEEDMAVRGHLCAGLRRFQEGGRGCKPIFGPKGSVSGCDDTNYVYITHCPFCGELLPVMTQTPNDWADIYWAELDAQDGAWQAAFLARELYELPITEATFVARVGIEVVE